MFTAISPNEHTEEVTKVTLNMEIEETRQNRRVKRRRKYITSSARDDFFFIFVLLWKYP